MHKVFRTSQKFRTISIYVQNFEIYDSSSVSTRSKPCYILSSFIVAKKFTVTRRITPPELQWPTQSCDRPHPAGLAILFYFFFLQNHKRLRIPTRTFTTLFCCRSLPGSFPHSPIAVTRRRRRKNSFSVPNISFRIALFFFFSSTKISILVVDIVR